MTDPLDDIQQAQDELEATLSKLVQNPADLVADILDKLTNSSFPEDLAKFNARMFRALKEEGFNDHQALQIVCSSKLPGGTS